MSTFVRLLMFFFLGGTYYLYRDLVSYNPTYIKIAIAMTILGMFYMLTAPLTVATCGGLYIILCSAFKG